MAQTQPEFYEHELAAERLLDADPGAIPPLDELLLSCLWDGRVHVRRNAALALALRGEAVHERMSLLTVAAKDSDSVVREYALQALGRVEVDVTDAVPALMRARLDKVKAVSEAALVSLDQLLLAKPALVAPELVPAAVAPVFKIAQTARELLLRGGAHSVRPLVAELGNHKDEVADLCAALLDELGPVIIEGTLEALTEPLARRRAMALLRRYPPVAPAFRQRLAELAATGDPGTAAAARQMLEEANWTGRQPREPFKPPHPAFGERLLSAEERAAAAQDTSLAMLLRAAQEPQPFARANAAWLLRDVAPEETMALGLSPLARDSEETVRLAAAEALRQRPLAELAPQTLALATDPSHAVRSAGAEALRALSEVHAPSVVLGAVRSGQTAALDAVRQALSPLPAAAEAALARTLHDAPLATVRWLAADVLGRAQAKSEAAVRALTAGLDDAMEDVRVACAWALGRSGTAEPSALAALSRASEDRVGAVRRAAFLSTASITGRPLPGSPPLEAASEPVDGFFSSELDGKSLGRAAARIGVEKLVGLLGDGRATARRNAAVALGALGSTAAEAVNALTVALRDSHPSVREAAVAALATVSKSSSRERTLALVAALRDASPTVKAAAQRALAERGADAASALVEALDEAPGFVQSSVLPLLRRLGSDAVPTLLAATSKHSPQRRQFASLLLGELAPPSDAASLKALDALAAGDPEAAVRREAKRGADALRERTASASRPAPRAFPTDGFATRLLTSAELAASNDLPDEATLLGWLADGRAPVRANAMRALGLLGNASPDALAAVARALKDTDGAVQRAAVDTTASLRAGTGETVANLVALARGGDRAVDEAIAAALVALGPIARDTLFALLELRPEHILPPGARLARRSPELWLEVLARALAGGKNTVVRENAAELLTLMGAAAASAVPTLLAALEDQEVLLRCKVIRAVAAVAQPTAAVQNALRKVAQQDNRTSVQLAIDDAFRLLRSRAPRAR
jgi:HEAT repeat protein